MAFTDVLLGRPLATSEERAEHIGVSAGIPIFGLDALTSAAYGPEQALYILIPLGMFGIKFLLPIISAIARRLRLIQTAAGHIRSRAKTWVKVRVCWQPRR